MSRVTSTKNQIVEGAFAALLADGLPNLSYDRVAQASGTSRQLVRYHYRDPDALMVAICDRLAAAQAEVLAAGAELPGEDRLNRILDFYFDLLDDREKPRDDQAHDALLARAMSSQGVREALRSQHATLGETVAAAARDAHPGMSEAEAAELSYLFVVLMYGHWRMVASLGFSEAHKTVARRAIDRLLASYRTGDGPAATNVDIWSVEDDAA